MKGDPDSGIREIFACEIWTPEPRNLAVSQKNFFGPSGLSLVRSKFLKMSYNSFLLKAL